MPVADPQQDGGQHAAASDPVSTAILTWSSASELPPKASSPISSDTVNPMPPRIATPVTSGQVSPFCSGCRVTLAVR